MVPDFSGAILLMSEVTKVIHMLDAKDAIRLIWLDGVCTFCPAVARVLMSLAGM
jgi:hypothetical protein